MMKENQLEDTSSTQPSQGQVDRINRQNPEGYRTTTAYHYAKQFQHCVHCVHYYLLTRKYQ